MRRMQYRDATELQHLRHQIYWLRLGFKRKIRGVGAENASKIFQGGEYLRSASKKWEVTFPSLVLFVASYQKTLDARFISLR